MSGDNVIEMSVSVLNKLIQFNKDAEKAVAPVGGNSVQEGYKKNTIAALEKQRELLDIFIPSEGA